MVTAALIALGACGGGRSQSPEAVGAANAGPDVAAADAAPELDPGEDYPGGCVRWQPPGTGCQGWSPPPPVAQSGTDDELRARASELFRRGQRHAENAEYSAAIPWFERSYQLVQEPVILFNIALMHARNLDRACAIDAYQAFLATGPGDPLRGDAEAALAEVEAALEEQLAAGRPPLTDSAYYCDE